MTPRAEVDPAALRASLTAVDAWVRGETDERPPRAVLADAVRASARTLAQLAPGASVEVRVPPFVAVQCIEGTRHRRGTPPNVVETDARTWLRVVVGEISFDEAVASGAIDASGSRAGDVGHWLPLAR